MQPVNSNTPLFYNHASQLYIRTFPSDDPQAESIPDRSAMAFFEPAGNPSSFVEACRVLFSRAKYSVPFSPGLLRSSFVTVLIKKFHEKNVLVDGGTVAVKGLDQTAKEAYCNAVAECVVILSCEQFGDVQLDPLEPEAIAREVKETLSQIYLKETRRLARYLALSSDPIYSIKAELEERHFDPHHPAIQSVLEESRVALKTQELERPMPLDYLEGLIRTRQQQLSQRVLHKESAAVANAAEEGNQASFLRECQSDFEKSFSGHPFPLQEFISKYIEVAAQTLVSLYGFSERVGEAIEVRGLCRFELGYKADLIENRIAKELKIDCDPEKLPPSYLRQIINEQFNRAYSAAIRDKAGLILKSRL